MLLPLIKGKGENVTVLKIYFAASIRGGRDDIHIYQLLIKLLANYGNVLTEHIGDPSLVLEKSRTDQEIYRRDVSWIDQCDFVVAEVTNPSLGVGYEIAYAEARNKKILCLYRQTEGKRVSAMVLGNPNTEIAIVEYKNPDILENILSQYFQPKKE